MRLSLYNASIIAGIWKATAKQFVGRSISSPPHPPLKRSVLKTPRVILQLKWKKKTTEHKQK